MSRLDLIFQRWWFASIPAINKINLTEDADGNQILLTHFLDISFCSVIGESGPNCCSRTYSLQVEVSGLMGL